jgi:hypothetical protein
LGIVSTQITTAHVQQYRSNVEFLVQQKGSRLRGAVRVESQTGKNAFYDQIGVASAQELTTRHADTPRMDTPHARRRVTLRDFVYADLVDEEDKVRILIDPAGKYTTAAMWALGRSMDDIIIEAVQATAYTGETGSSSTSYDSGMTVDVQVRDTGVSASDWGLNVAKLIEAKKLLDNNDVDPDEPRYIIVNGTQMSSLLKTTKATSADYASVKALVKGEIDTFMGFKFLQTNRITQDGNSDDNCPFWARDGMLLAIGRDIMADIGPRRDKNNATQVLCKMSIGATRMQEDKVGYIECDVSTGPGA